jgi:hypothetical protein
MNKQPHGRPGHFNLRIPDECRVITGYGKHARVLATYPKANGLYCRVDRPCLAIRLGDSQYPNLPDPTPEQVLAVARKEVMLRGRWKLRSATEWDGGARIDYWFDPA